MQRRHVELPGPRGHRQTRGKTRPDPVQRIALVLLFAVLGLLGGCDSANQPPSSDRVEPAPPPVILPETKPVPATPLPETAAPGDDGFPVYPWPPEQPSSLVSLSDLFDFSAGRDTTLFDVGEKLRKALQAAGYLERRYYAAPGGFVMVTRLEQTDAAGTPLAGGRRYQLPDDDGDFSFTRYIRELFFAPEGHYRFIAFVVTDQAYTVRDAHLAEETALTRLHGGSVALPDAYRTLMFSTSHRVDALIYEFRKTAQAGEVQPITPGRLPPAAHLDRSGLSDALQAAVTP